MINNDTEEKFRHEQDHGIFLAANDPEIIWGWGSPAGRIRARRRGDFIMQDLALNPGSKLLEIGCGTGLFTAYFAETGHPIIAVDISRELLDLARKRNLDPDQVTFMCKAFETCDVDGPFDAVVGSSILHHLETPWAFEKIFQLLKPGGILSFAEPNMLNPQIYAVKNFKWLGRFLGESPDETAFVRFKLKQVLSTCGFTDINIQPFDWLHPLTPKPLIGIVSSCGRLAEKIPFLREFSGSLSIKARRPLNS